MSDQLQLQANPPRTAWKPGETMKLSGLWALEELPDRIEARLYWSTAGKGTTDIQVVDVRRVSEISTAGEATFTFLLPTSPYSFSGRLITLQWAVELVAGQSSARFGFSLSPTGVEIDLTSTVAEPPKP